MPYVPAEAIRLFEEGASVTEVVDAEIPNYYDEPAKGRTVRRWFAYWREGIADPEDRQSKEDYEQYPEDCQEKINFEETVGGATVSGLFGRIVTLEQLLELAQVDLSLWEVDHYVVNKWEVGARDQANKRIVIEPLVQVKAWLKRREIAPVEMSLDNQIALLKKYAPQYQKTSPYSPDGQYLFSPQMYDAHVNKRSVDGTYTIQQAADDFKRIGRAIIARALSLNLPIGRIMLPVGNDALHADNLLGTTTAGTWVEVAADQRDAVDAVCDAYVDLAECLSQIAPLDIVVVESNHDRYSSFWLGKFLDAWFQRHDGVSVDYSRHPRKYYRYGKVLLGLDHGEKVRPSELVSLMAVEAREMWAQTSYHEWLRGHFHKHLEMYYAASETMGVLVRVIPALCPPDQYHLLRGFVGNHRAAEGIFYHKEHGPAGVFPVFVDELPEN